MVATTIQLRVRLGIVSDTEVALTGKSMPIPIPIKNWPSNTHSTASAHALINAPGDGHPQKDASNRDCPWQTRRVPDRAC
jgi:hypothetical protein